MSCCEIISLQIGLTVINSSMVTLIILKPNYAYSLVSWVLLYYCARGYALQSTYIWTLVNQILRGIFKISTIRFLIVCLMYGHVDIFDYWRLEWHWSLELGRNKFLIYLFAPLTHMAWFSLYSVAMFSFASYAFKLRLLFLWNERWIGIEWALVNGS